jgi:hypothetical protein
MGAGVIATTGTEEKARHAHSLGADRVVVYKKEAFEPIVMEETGGRGADVILDFIGGPYLERNVSAAALMGRIVLIGVLGAPRGEVDVTPFFSKRLTMIGTTLRARPLEHKIDLTQRFVKQLLPLFVAGRLKPIVDSVFSLDDIADAHRYMEEDRNFGKIIVRTLDIILLSEQHSNLAGGESNPDQRLRSPCLSTELRPALRTAFSPHSSMRGSSTCFSQALRTPGGVDAPPRPLLERRGDAEYQVLAEPGADDLQADGQAVLGGPARHADRRLSRQVVRTGAFHRPRPPTTRDAGVGGLAGRDVRDGRRDDDIDQAERGVNSSSVSCGTAARR